MADGTERRSGAWTRELRARARAAGFDEIGIAAADPPARDVARLDAWLASGRHASMRWMERHASARKDPERLLPGCRSIVMVTLDYAGDDRPARGPGHGRVARYARGRDYHRAFAKPLRRLAAWLQEATGKPARTFVDTGPVLERAFAERCGLGWIGKNACLIAPHRGSWLLLGEILTAAELEADPGPAADQCGSCTACLTACPTGAIVDPGIVDANRCVAYWTIEHRGAITTEMRAGIGDRLFGCDDCQSVCPWNRSFARRASDANVFEPRPELSSLDAAEILRIDETSFRRRFEGTALMRARRDGLRRNACVVLGNSGDPAAVEVLTVVLDDDDAVVRGHAAWALGRLGGASARRALLAAREREREASVRAEIDAALDSIPVS